MQNNAERPPRPRATLNRWLTSTTAHLRKWVAGPGQRVQSSFMHGAATKLGEFATTVVIAWLIYRR
ncbi:MULTISPECIES: hypothetical protein [unclassified Streptomyces]|uniref:hypothetical protein n=1 Tax=unclassified Streptomyces TaxID=2593676 RepID=UPI000A67D60D|nr:MULTISPECIES: hypothetical protein [unclassified Streptomyces]